jgi:DNA-binding PadR family transcriptional regulator
VSGLETPYGLAIKRRLEGYYETEVNHGRLYPNLDSLVGKGLVEKSALDKRTNLYVLSAAGREAIATRRAWETENVGAVDVGASVQAEPQTT